MAWFRGRVGSSEAQYAPVGAVNHTHRRRSYKGYIFAILGLLAVILLYFNAEKAPRSVRNLYPACPTSECVQFDCSSNIPDTDPSPRKTSAHKWTFEPDKHADDYGLSVEQCDAAFPGLFTEIEHQVEARKDRPITEAELTRKHWKAGMIRLMIYDGQLYVLDTKNPTLRRSRQFSTLLAINRALIASPNRHTIPNIEFVISIEDWTVDKTLPVWSYDRRSDENNTWIMPDFGFWGWPEPGIGTYAEVRKRMQDVEEEFPSFLNKTDKLFWRGAIVPSVAPRLRTHMMDQIEGQPWADLKVLNWQSKDPTKSNRVPMEEHCKYRYLINTEGRAWSGRLKYIQNCRSVIVAHKMEWIVPHEYLMVADGPKQNFIQVERDFSDLKEKMEYITTHPEVAEMIADNSVQTFRDRYLTPAAEACYWRKMIYGWSKVSWEPRFYDGEGKDKKWRGVPYDSYVLMRKMHWDPY